MFGGFQRLRSHFDSGQGMIAQHGKVLTWFWALVEIFNCSNTKHMFFTIIFHKQSMQSDYWIKRIFTSEKTFSRFSFIQYRDGTFMIIITLIFQLFWQLITLRIFMLEWIGNDAIYLFTARRYNRSIERTATLCNDEIL